MILKNLLRKVGILVMTGIVLASNLAFAIPASALEPGDSVDEIHFSYGENTGEVVFNWRGNESTIYYGLDTNYGSQATAQSSAITPWDTTGPFFEVKIIGLTDNTQYHYKIGEFGLDHSFKTKPTGDFNWVDVGDTVSSHCFSYMPALHQLINNQQPNLVTHGGDISVLDGCGIEAPHSYYTDQENWSRSAAFQPVWGNHEFAEAKPEAPAGTPRDSLANYKGRSYITNAQTVPSDTLTKTSNPGCGSEQSSSTNTCMGEDWGWFDVGKVRFISYPEPWPGAIEDWRTKAETLMQQAQSDTNIDFIITYGHRPPYTNSNEGPNLTVRSAVDYLAQKYSPHSDNLSGKYILNIGHHAHGLEAYGKVNGLMHVISAAGGQGFTPTVSDPNPPSEFRVRHLGILAGNYSAQNGTLNIKLVCGPEFLWVQDVCEYGTTLWNMQFTKSQVATPQDPATTLKEWVTNTSLESNITGWSGKYGSSNYITVGHSTEAAHTGTASVKVAATTGANNLSSGFNDNPKVIASTTANTEYTQSVWVKPSYIGQKITLRLREWRPDWSMAGEVSKTLTPTTTDWQQISQTYTTKQSGNNLAYIVHANAISSGQYFYADDLSLTTGQVSTPSEPQPEDPPVVNPTPIATSLYSYNLDDPQSNVIANKASLNNGINLNLVGNYNNSTFGTFFDGDKISKQSVGYAQPSTGLTLDTDATDAVGTAVAFRFNLPQGTSCLDDSKNITQIGRFGAGLAQIKLQLSTCGVNSSQVFLQCRMAGSNSTTNDTPVTHNQALIPGQAYIAQCYKAPDPVSGSAQLYVKLIKIDTLNNNPSVLQQFSITPTGDMQSNAALSVANKYQLPSIAQNTDQFVGDIARVAYCKGNDVTAVSDCLSTEISPSNVEIEPEPTPEPPIPPAPTQEWVTNPSVETSLTGWTGKYGSSPYIEVTRSTESARTGIASIKVRALSGASGLNSGFNASPRWVTNATAGKTYTGSVWLKPGHVGQVINLSLIEWNGSTKVNEVKTKITATSTSWQQMSVNLPIQQNGTSIAFAVYGSSMNAGQYFYADDLSLTSPN